MSFLLTVGETNVFFFRKRIRKIEQQEAQIQAIRHDNRKRIEAATEKIDKLGTLLDNEDIGITEAIFYATGGRGRIDGNKK